MPWLSSAWDAELACDALTGKRHVPWRCLCAPLCATLHEKQTYAVASPAWISKLIHHRRAGHEQVGSTSHPGWCSDGSGARGKPARGLGAAQRRASAQVRLERISLLQHCSKTWCRRLATVAAPQQEGAKLWDRRLLTRPGAGEPASAQSSHHALPRTAGSAWLLRPATCWPPAACSGLRSSWPRVRWKCGARWQVGRPPPCMWVVRCMTAASCIGSSLLKVGQPPAARQTRAQPWLKLCTGGVLPSPLSDLPTHPHCPKSNADAAGSSLIHVAAQLGHAHTILLLSLVAPDVPTSQNANGEVGSCLLACWRT